MDDDVRRRIADNMAHWDHVAPIHAASRMYDVDRFVTDPEVVSTVVAHDLEWLGPLSGSAVHLQCHIGTDTISLARSGAAPVVGVDLSGESIAQARRLAAASGDDVEYVVSDVHDAPAALRGRRFDLVYTGVGALCWLPSITDWADVVDELLAPGGRVWVRDVHPVLMALDDERDDDLLVLRHPYFETEDATTWEIDETYTDVPDGHEVRAMATHEWSHGIGEVVTALLERGLVLRHLREHTRTDWQPWELFEPVADGFWALPPHLRDRAPTMFSMLAEKPREADG
jgi:SAM-dependent methyltransferase